MRQHSPTRQEATPSAIIYGSCGVSRWCGRKPGKDKNTDNTNKELLKLNPSLSCKPLTSSKLATLSYADMLRKRSATLSNADTDIKPATKRLIYSYSEETKNEKIKHVSSKNVKLFRPSVPNFDFITVRHQEKAKLCPNFDLITKQSARRQKENAVLAAVSKPVVDSNVHVLNVHKQPMTTSNSNSVRRQRVLLVRTGHNFKPSSLIVTKQ